jgi:Icc-related predicted phosphoesterase
VDAEHFTFASTASGHLSQSELDWIDRDLAATDRPVKIVTTHYPPFDPDGSAHILYSGNEAFLALMEKHQVAHVFTGHIHAYSQEERNGTVYTVTGGGGAPLKEDEHPNSFYHYVQVTVDGEQIQTQVMPLD